MGKVISFCPIELLKDGKSNQFLPNRIANYWNKIPTYVKDAPSVDSFKNRLELYKTKKLPVVIVNPAAPVGPRDIKPTPTGKMVLDAAMKKIPAYLDTGLNIVHVDDVAKGHIQAFNKGKLGERYILGGENLTLKEMLEILLLPIKI